MTIILGIDPGSRITGYGVIAADKQRFTHIASGCVQLKTGDLSHRLQSIYQSLLQVIEQYNPQQVAIEEVFMHRNPNSAIKLGQARGAAIVAAGSTGLSIAEYSARQIKQATVGYGAADKQQIQHMVKVLLNIKQDLQTDAADALAVAICHANTGSKL